MEQHATSVARSTQEADDAQWHANRLSVQLLCNRTNRHGLDVQLDLAGKLGLGHIGFVLKHDVECGQAGGGVSQYAAFNDLG